MTTLGAPEQPITDSRGQVLDLIRRHDPISRTELTSLTGLAAASISVITRALIDQGLVAEVGRGASTGGKPRTMLSLQAASRHAIGVSLGESGLTYAVLDYAGSLVARWRRRGSDLIGDPDLVQAVVAADLDALLQRAEICRDSLLGLALVTPGPWFAGADTSVTPPGMERWRGQDLGGALRARWGVPVSLDNDATASAIGAQLAHGADSQALGAVFMSRGIGAGLQLAGRSWTGAHGNAGELGHTVVELDGPTCWCGGAGCLEQVAGPGRVVAEARGRGLAVTGPESTLLSEFASVARLALRGDPVAAGLIDHSARHLAQATVSMVNLLDLDTVVLTGPAFSIAGPLYLPVVRAAVARGAVSGARVRVILDDRGTATAAIGAATMVLKASQ